MLFTDSDHFQQRLSTWPGPISANFFGAVLIVFAIIFLPVGTQTLSAANNVRLRFHWLCFCFDQGFECRSTNQALNMTPVVIQPALSLRPTKAVSVR